MPAGVRRRVAAIDHLNVIAMAGLSASYAVPSVLAPGTTAEAKLAAAMLGFSVPALLVVAGFLATHRKRIDVRRTSTRVLLVVGPYLVASLVAWLVGLWRPLTPYQAAFDLAAGSALGVYYLVPVLVCCYLTLPLVSRLPTAALAVFILLLAAYALHLWLHPSSRLTVGLFWQGRDVFLQFHLGHFLLGVLASRLSPMLRRAHTRAAPLTVALSLAAVGAFAWAAVNQSLWVWAPLARTGYLLGVVGLMASTATRGAAPALVRFLSDATLTIFLYHQMIYPLVVPSLRAALPLGVAVPVVTVLGVALGAVIACAGRTMLGERSRALVGV